MVVSLSNLFSIFSIALPSFSSKELLLTASLIALTSFSTEERRLFDQPAIRHVISHADKILWIIFALD